MTCVYKILLVCVLMEWCEGDKVLQSPGFTFHKKIEFNFKPFPIKRITFMKQAWSPLGSFIKKFAIQKRSLDEMMSTTPMQVGAPVVEEIQEEPIGTEPLAIIPQAPVIAYMPIGPTLPTPLPQPMPIIVHDYPLPPVKPLPVPPISSNLVETSGVSSSNELHTDISQVKPIKEYLDATKPLSTESPEPFPISGVLPIPGSTIAPIENVGPEPGPQIVSESPPPLPPPPPPISPVSPDLVPSEAPEPIPVLIEEVNEETPPQEAPPPVEENVPTSIVRKDGPLVRGTKIALHFGKIFMSLMGQFFENAQASIDLITAPL